MGDPQSRREAPVGDLRLGADGGAGYGVAEGWINRLTRVTNSTHR